MNTDTRQKIFECLSYDGGQAVFEYYGFDLNKKLQKYNPFNPQQKTSSLYISFKSGVWVFKDFSLSEKGGGAWKIVQLMEGTEDSGRILSILAEIYNLSYLDLKGNDTKRIIPARKIKQVKEGNPKELKHINFRHPSSEELDFLSKKISVSKAEAEQVVQKGYIKVVESFVLHNPNNGKDRTFSGLSYIFAYEIVKGRAYKLYMPKEETRVYGRAKTAYLPNLIEYKRVNGEDARYLYTPNRPDPTRTTYVTGGEMDCIALLARGLNAITFGGETSTLNDWQKELISGINPVFCFDTDYTGLKAMRELDKQGYKTITLPRLEKQEDKNSVKPKYNDICDYLELFGEDYLFRAMFQNEYVFNLSETEFIGDKINNLISIIDTEDRIYIKGGTGTGKSSVTRMIADHYKQNYFTLVCAPANIIAEQKAHINNVPCLTASTLKNEFSSLPDDCYYAFTNYNNLERCVNIIRSQFSKDVIVVIDEAHELVLSESYRSDIVRNLFEIAEMQAKTICLSATPIQTIFTEYIKVGFLKKLEHDLPPPNVFFTGNVEAQVRRIVEKSPNRRHLILLNKKESLERLKNGFGEKAHIITSLNTIQNDDIYRELVEKGVLDGDVMVLLNTQKLVMGFDLNASEGDEYEITYVNTDLGKFDFLSCRQYFGRCRDFSRVKGLNIIVKVSGEEKKEGSSVSEFELFDTYRKFAEGRAERINKDLLYASIVDGDTSTSIIPTDETLNGLMLVQEAKTFVSVNEIAISRKAYNDYNSKFPVWHFFPNCKVVKSTGQTASDKNSDIEFNSRIEGKIKDMICSVKIDDLMAAYAKLNPSSEVAKSVRKFNTNLVTNYTPENRSDKFALTFIAESYFALKGFGLSSKMCIDLVRINSTNKRMANVYSFLVTNHNTSISISKAYEDDVRDVIGFIGKFEIGEEVSSEDIFSRYKDSFPEFVNKTKGRATRLFKSFYECVRIRGKYKIKGLVNIESFL